MDTPEGNRNDKNRMFETKISGLYLFHYINNIS